MHDASVDRTTNGSGKIVDMSSAQVGRLRLNDGSRVPRLSAFLHVASSSATVDVIPELKSLGRERANYRDYAHQVRAFGRGRVIASSFDTAQLARLHRIAPRIRESIIEGRHLLSPKQVKPYDTVTMRYGLVTKRWLHRMPFPVFIYTPDTPKHWRYANRVRAVITNEPVAFAAYRRTACGTQ
jgi:glycerophosphoryl diester phosphodiesterase